MNLRKNSIESFIWAKTTPKYKKRIKSLKKDIHLS
jgi:hypothetical protein